MHKRFKFKCRIFCMNDMHLLESLELLAVGLPSSMYIIKTINYFKKPGKECTDNFCSFGRSFRKNWIYLVLPFPADYFYVIREYYKSKRQ